MNQDSGLELMAGLFNPNSYPRTLNKKWLICKFMTVFPFKLKYAHWYASPFPAAQKD